MSGKGLDVMRIGRLMSGVAVVIIGLSMSAWGEKITLQEGLDGYAGIADTWLGDKDKSTNHGQETSLLVNKDGSAKDKDVLIRFDLSGLDLPEDAVITSVQLKLNYFGNDSLGSSDYLDVSVYGARKGWVESEATWTKVKTNPNTDWAAEGARGTAQSGGDRKGDPDATRRISGSDAFGWVEWTSQTLTDTVKGWLDDPSTNNGLVIDYSDSKDGTSGVSFYSSEAETSTVRPQLELEFTVVPEPATLGVLGLGALALFRRRRS